MRRLVTAAVLSLGLLVPSSPARAADPPPDATALQTGLAGLAEAGGVGIVARVTQGGQTWAGAYGEASPGVAATPDARFRAGSVTKSVVAVLALQQVQHGRWTMDTTVGDVLPGLLPEHRDVTLRELLSHTSGAPDYLAAVVAGARSYAAWKKVVQQRRSDKELIDVARGLPWEFEPGSSWSYSNTNFVVLGAMLSSAIDKPLGRIAQRRVFDRAGMTSSALARTPKVKVPELVEQAVFGKRLRDVSFTSPTLYAGAGALVTTTADLDRFQAALTDGTLLAAPQLRAMRRVVGGNEAGYGLGSYRLPDPCGGKRDFLYGHDGATLGTLTVSFSTPDGATRVSAAMTGRNLDSVRAKDSTALFTYAFTAFAARCGASAAPAAAVDEIAERAAATYAR